MEKLLHYVWKHRLFQQSSLSTTSGHAVEVIDTGLHNFDAGPDFFNAKIKIDSQTWVGNVELHLKSSQWYQHHHEEDKAYDNVILHVVTEADAEVRNSQNEVIPQVVISIPETLKTSYEHLLTEDRYPRCFRIIPELPKLTVHAWMSALQTERLSRKTEDILKRVERCNGSWEEAFFQTLARNYGFGINSEAFELWANNITLHAVDHHRDDLFQIEAFFMGQAGLLNEYAIPERHRDALMTDVYFHRLASEYKYLAHKFSLTPMDPKMWRFLRLRPQNFPFIRLSQLAMLYYNRKAGLSQILECENTKELRQALKTQVSEYWQTHYIFGEESEKNEKHMSSTSIDVLIINTVIPMMFAYGRYHQNDKYVDKALSLLEEIKPEDNNIVRMWKECSLNVENAGDSQALIQLKKEYCDKKECLRCRIGYFYLKGTTKNI